MKRLVALTAALALTLLAAVPPGDPVDVTAQAKERLAQLAGTWDYEVSFMGMPPMKGSETNTLMKHGLALITVATGDAGPMGKFEGHGMFGYDARGAKWLHAWTDNADPNFSVSEARWADDGKSFTVEEKADFGMGPQDMKMVTTITGADTREFVMKPTTADAQAMIKMSYKRRP